MATMATATLTRRRRRVKRPAAVLAKGNFYCPKCKRKIETHISTRAVYCSRCNKSMKRLN